MKDLTPNVDSPVSLFGILHKQSKSDSYIKRPTFPELKKSEVIVFDANTSKLKGKLMSATGQERQS